MITKEFLDKLQTEIDAMLDAETNETLLDWLNNRHKQLLQQTQCTTHVCLKCGDMGRCEPRTLESPDGQECDCGQIA